MLDMAQSKISYGFFVHAQFWVNKSLSMMWYSSAELREFAK
jgi:hypothetical protein